MTGLGLCHKGRQQLGEQLQIKESREYCSLAAADCRDWKLFVDSRPLSRLGEDRPGPIPGLVRSRELQHFGDSRSSYESERGLSKGK